MGKVEKENKQRGSRKIGENGDKDMWGYRRGYKKDNKNKRGFVEFLKYDTINAQEK